MEDVKVFISHRHSDKNIANAINEHLQDWGVSQGSIFLSTRPGQGVPIGEHLVGELRGKIDSVNLLILVYTYTAEDWSYCMWECGIATGHSSVETKIVVFQCTQDVPRVFQDQTRVMVSEDGIKAFVNNFYNEVGFVPGVVDDSGQPRAISPGTGEVALQKKSDRFYESLRKKIPLGKMSNMHISDFIRLRIDAHYMSDIYDTEEQDQAIDIILKQTQVIEPIYEGVGGFVGAAALRQFGYQGFVDSLTLEMLINRWKDQDQTKNYDWIDELLQAMYRALSNYDSLSVSSFFKSVRNDTDWNFMPVVTRVRGFPDNSKEFDMYLVRVDLQNK